MPTPVQMTREQYQAKYGTAPAVASSASSAGAPVQMTREQYQAKYGTAPVSTATPAVPKDGGNPLVNFAKGIFGPAATLAARPFQAAADFGDYLGTKIEADKAQKQGNTGAASAILAADAAREKEKQTNSSFGGFVAPQSATAADVKKDIGRGAQTVALGLGAPIVGGALFGAGASLEQGNDLLSAQTAFDTVLGAGGGKLLDFLGKPLLNAAGKVVGKISPPILKDIASRGSAAIQEFAANNKLLPDIASKPINFLAKGAQTVDNKIGAGARAVAGAPKAAFKSLYPSAPTDTFGAKLKDAEQAIYPNLTKGEKASTPMKDEKSLFGTKSVPDLQSNPATKRVIESVANLPDDIAIKPSDTVAVKDSKLSQGITRLHQDTASALREPAVKAQTTFKPADYDAYMKKNVLDPIEGEYGKTSKEYATAKKAIATSKKGIGENNAYGTHTGRQNFDTQFKEDNPRAFKLKNTLFGQLDPNVTSTVEAGYAVRKAMNDFTESLLPKNHPFRYRLREESNLIKGLEEMRKRSTGEIGKTDIQRYLNRNPAVKKGVSTAASVLKLGTGVKLIDFL